MALPTPARVLAILAIADRALAGSGSTLPIRRLALRRLRRRRAIAVAQAAAMALAVGLPVALQFVAAISAEAGYRAAVDPARADSFVTVEKLGGQDAQGYGSEQEATQASVDTYTQNRLLEVAELGRVSSFRITSENGKPYVWEELPPLFGVFYPQLQAHSTLVAGSWPSDAAAGWPIPVAISEAAAALYVLHAGDVACVISVTQRSTQAPEACVQVAGIYRSGPVSDPFWQVGPRSTDLAFGRAGYWAFQARPWSVTAVADRVYRPNPELLAVAGAPDLQHSIERLRGSVQYAQGQRLLTGLDYAIAAYLGRAALNQFPVQLISVEVAAVVLFGLAFITQGFLGAQEQQAALWRIRGWSRPRLAAFLGLQVLFLAVPAVLAGVGGAVAVAWGVAAGRHADLAELALNLATGGAAALGLSLAAALAICLALVAGFALRSVSALKRAAAHSVREAWWRSRRLDLLLAAAAVPVLAEASLRTHESVRGATPGADPIGVTLPILGLGMLSVATLRLLPLLARPVRLAAGRVYARLAYWRLSRHATEHVGVALVLSLTLGVGVFASVYDRTETTNTVERAAYATGADLRVAFTDGTGPAVLRSTLAGVKGARAATPVLREKVYVSGSSDAITAVGIDPATFAAAAWSRPGLSSPDLVSAVRRMAAAPGYRELAGPVAELSIWARGLDQPGTLDADLRDAQGQRCAPCSFGSLDFADWRQLHLSPSFAAPPRYPLRLYALEFNPARAAQPGDFALSLLQATRDGSAEPDVVETFADADGWWAGGADGLAFAPGSSAPVRLGSTSIDLQVGGAGRLRFNAPFASAGLSALMAAPTMARLGLRPGMSIPLSVGGREARVRLAGAIDLVPTLYPGTDDFVVLPLDQMLSVFSAVTQAARTPDELWVSLSEAGWASVQQFRPGPSVDFTVNRRRAEQVALSDPVLVQLRANLAIGFASALALAVLAFAVHFLIAVRRRLAEHSVLQANGLDPEDIRRGIAIEQAVVVVFAVLVASALALVEILLLLPSLQLGTSPESLLPPTVVRVDWVQLGLGVVLAAALLLGLGWLTRRAATSVDVVEELRRLG